MKLALPVAFIVFAAGACCCCGGDSLEDFDPAELGLPATPAVGASGSASAPVPANEKVRVVSVHSEDAYYSDRAKIEGRECVTSAETTLNDGYHGGSITCGSDSYYFYKVELVDLGAAPAAPSSAVAGTRAKESLPSGTRVKILDVAADDAYYSDRTTIIGKLCTLQEASSFKDGEWHGGSITCDDASSYYFYKAAYERQ